MENLNKNILKNSFELGKFSFFIGLFLLPSAISLSIIFLLFSLIFSFWKSHEKIFNEKINLIFLISSFLFILSSVFNYFDKNTINNISDTRHLIFVGLLNWIPLIFAFFGFQKYLTESRDRKNCILILIAGSMPVIFTCYGQLFFNWHGPMSTLFGLITWYSRPIYGITGVTGLFNNPNYLAAWFNIIWPFCLALMFFDKKDKLKFIFKIILIISISFLQILTASRAGLVCLFIPLIFIYGAKFKKWIFGLFSLILILILNLYLPIFGINFQIFLQKLIPNDIWLNFTDLGYQNLDITRIGIWNYALNFILERPLLGHGSSSFTSLLMDETGFWKGHAHNLPLELMVNYGLLVSLSILLPIIYIVYKSYFKLYFKKNVYNKHGIFDRAWIISLTLLIFMQLVDIQYFDGRISITGWILLAGTKNIGLNYDNNKYEKVLKN